MAFDLTNKGLSRVLSGESIQQPVFQLLGLKLISKEGKCDQYRFQISDGDNHYNFVMLASHQNHLVVEDKLNKFCIFKVNNFMLKSTGDKLLLILLDLTVHINGRDINSAIGTPVPFVPKQNVAEQAMSEKSAEPAPSCFNYNPPDYRKPPASLAVKGTPRSTPPSALKPSAEIDWSKLPNKSNPTKVYKPEDPSVAPKFMTTIGEPMRPIAPTPIAGINSIYGKYKILARVTSKSDIRTWANSKGTGKLFNVHFLDQSGEIRMTAFNKEVDNLYDQFQVGKLYTIIHFRIQLSNRTFNPLNHVFELHATSDTLVASSSETDESVDIALHACNFLHIAGLESVDIRKLVDVVGVCRAIGNLETVTSKRNNKLYRKRDIVLGDTSLKEIRLTLWEDQAINFENESNSIIVVRGAKVTEYRGRNLSCLFSTSIWINPNLSEANDLRKWYEQEGSKKNFTSLSQLATPWKGLKEATSLLNPSIHINGEYFMSKVNVIGFKETNAMYKGCTKPKCNRKVKEYENNFYHCERCETTTSDFDWKFSLSVQFSDIDSTIWATCFTEAVELILSTSAETTGPMFSDDSAGFAKILDKSKLASFIGKFKCVSEVFENETIVKTTVLELIPINQLDYAKKLLQEIKETGTA